MRTLSIILATVLFAVAGLAADPPQCEAQGGQITNSDVQGSGIAVTTPANGQTTSACVNCCDHIVISNVPAGALVDVKWAATWVYTGATNPPEPPNDNLCDTPTPLYSFTPGVAQWLAPIADREVIAEYDQQQVVNSGSLTVKICTRDVYPDISDWKSPEIHIDLLINVTAPDGETPLITNYSGGGGGWDPVCQATGCTPGYWKNTRKHPWDCSPYSTSDVYATVFAVNCTGLNCAGLTLEDGVNLGGGHEKALIRHSVAALLNSSCTTTAAAWCAQSPFYGLGYPLTEAQVISLVQQAYASGDFESAHQTLAGYNEDSICSADRESTFFGPNSCTDEQKFCDYWLGKGDPLP